MGATIIVSFTVNVAHCEETHIMHTRDYCVTLDVFQVYC